MPITALPVAPSRSTDTPATFATKADALLAALAQFVTDANALQTDCNNQQTTATAQAAAALVQAAAAANSALQAGQSLAAAQAVSGATKWVSGTAYAQGAVVWSPATGQNYRARVALSAGVSTTDPASDSTNWFALLLQQSLPVVQITAAGTYAASANIHYLLTVTGINLQFPASPNPGDLLGFTNVSGVTTNTADPNGKMFKGDATVMTINDKAASCILKYTTAQGWIKQ